MPDDLSSNHSASRPEIRRLPEAIVNRIAAGEVIERPAAAIKELVENSLDAGSSQITVSWRAGGRAEMVVEDDGWGMTADQLTLAIERHATSKLTDPELVRISSFGFRGEALPSIGSVARLTLETRAMDDPAGHGWAIGVDGGLVGDLRPSARARGTKVTVADLFHAVPARLKFLKSEIAESRAIVETLERLALAHPGVGLTALNEGRRRLALPAHQDQAVRIGALLGKEFLENAVGLDAERGEARLTGFAGLPTASRGTPDRQFLFVNGRPVKDRLLLGALRAGYRDLLARDRHPVVVLFLDVPPASVDVNVHPAKAEVRFRDQGNIRGLIVGAVTQALNEAGLRTASTLIQGSLGSPTRPGSGGGGGGWARLSARPASGLSPGYQPPHSQGLRETAFAAQAPLTPDLPPAARVEPEAAQDSTALEAPLGAAKAQIHRLYIVAETSEGLVLIDQHAAHERIVYEQLKAAVDEGGAKAQHLLLPEVVELEPEQATELLRHADALERLGLVLEAFGPGAVLVRATPALLGQTDAMALVRDLADHMDQMGDVDLLRDRLDHVCATIACHGSVRSGRSLSVVEMNALLRQMEQTPSASQCNHGRPTFVKLDLDQLERLFQRSG